MFFTVKLVGTTWNSHHCHHFNRRLTSWRYTEKDSEVTGRRNHSPPPFLSSSSFLLLFLLLHSGFLVIETHYVAQRGLKLKILLPHPTPSARMTGVYHYIQLMTSVLYTTGNVKFSLQYDSQPVWYTKKYRVKSCLFFWLNTRLFTHKSFIYVLPFIHAFI